MERLITDVTLVSLITTVRQFVILIIPFLMEALPTKFANKRLVPGMYSRVRV